jgi:uncharacterized protein YecE (DUF72 family)
VKLLRNELLTHLEPYRDRIGVLIFEFSAFPPHAFAECEAFLDALAPMFAQLPQTFRYAVEIRNPEFLTPGYLELLRDARIAHVFNSWTRMPSITEQMNLPGACTTDFTIARALLKPGRKYEEAVRLFSPYRNIQDPAPEVRNALRALLMRSKDERKPSYIFVNNRLEGNAPQSIEAVLADW